MTWEYLTWSPKRVTENVDELNRLGAEGWELVAVTTGHWLFFSGNWLFFKRPAT